MDVTGSDTIFICGCSLRCCVIAHSPFPHEVVLRSAARSGGLKLYIQIGLIVSSLFSYALLCEKQRAEIMLGHAQFLVLYHYADLAECQHFRTLTNLTSH